MNPGQWTKIQVNVRNYESGITYCTLCKNIKTRHKQRYDRSTPYTRLKQMWAVTDYRSRPVYCSLPDLCTYTQWCVDLTQPDQYKYSMSHFRICKVMGESSRRLDWDLREILLSFKVG